MSLSTCQHRVLDRIAVTACMPPWPEFEVRDIHKVAHAGPRHSGAVPLGMYCYDVRPNPPAGRHE
jgi:hypothetical protein